MDHLEKHVANAPTKCFVCGMKLTERATIVSRTYRAEVYSFCSEACADRFVGNPEEFKEEHDDDDL